VLVTVLGAERRADGGALCFNSTATEPETPMDRRGVRRRQVHGAGDVDASRFL